MEAFRNMHLFVEVARAGGFRAAAERLGMQNSTLSRRIAELERDVGLRLLNRSTRRVDLTEAGRLYFERCCRIIEDARLAQEELSGVLTQPTGLIRASVPVDFTLVYLSHILVDFLKQYPGISLDLDVTPRQSNLVTEPVDLTIRIGEPRDQQLIARKLATMKRALFAAPSCLAALGSPVSPSDLAKFNCLRVTGRPWTLVNRLTGEEQVVAVTGSVRANNIGLLRRLAVEGVGIATLAVDLAREDVAAGNLVQVLPDWETPDISVYALTQTRLVPAKVRVFIEFLSQRLGRS